MAVKVDLTLNDGSFSSRIKQASQSFGTLKTAISSAKNAQQAFNNVLRANPFGLISTAVDVAGQAIYNYMTGVYEAQRVQERMNEVLNDTSNRLNMMADDLDFDVRIAEAAGKSWEALHKLKLEAAQTAEALAWNTLMQVSDNGTKEQADQARAMYEAAAAKTKKLFDDSTVRLVKQLYGTGDSGSKKGSRSGSSTSSGNTKELTEQHQNQKKINELVLEYVELRQKAGTADNVERLASIQNEIQLLEKRNGLLSLYKEQAQGRLLPTDIKTEGLGNVTGIQKVSTDEINAFDLAKQGKDTQAAWQAAANAVHSASSAFSSIESPATKMLSIIGEAVANIALGFATASAQEGKGGIWYWIAATAAGLATMISTISAIHSATGFASGGIVGGNSYSGDNQFIRVNSGELILNRAQQNSLAQQLQGQGANLQLSATISGEKLRLVLNNNGRRTGRGEYVTTNFQ